jgi:hypothetical protein
VGGIGEIIRLNSAVRASGTWCELGWGHTILTSREDSVSPPLLFEIVCCQRRHYSSGLTVPLSK